MKRLYIYHYMTALLFFLFALAAPVMSETLPQWFIPLRDAVYSEDFSSEEIIPLYYAAVEKSSALSSEDRFLMLSRCENMMGLAYRSEGKNDRAAAHYAEGILFAERATEILPGADAYLLLAENISQSCAVRSTSYAIANGLKVEQYAKKALSFNNRNAAAQYLIAARWVFAPSPFNNYRKGIEMMTAILTEADNDKDDLFRVYSAIGYAYVQQKKYADARPWLLRSLEVYPTNKFAQGLLAKS